jgi:XRE family transcriptional regulator, aerobic/anaerobic benzoate catabolism transcriptional regulator
VAAKSLPKALEETVHPEVAQRLRGARAKIGMTRRQLAKASGTSERYLAHLEAGTGNPSLAVLNSLATALDIPVAELIPLGGERDEEHASVIAEVRRLPTHRLDELQSWLEQNRIYRGTKAHRIVLVGLRGAGKSSLGKHLSDRMGFPFFEISKEVEKAYGGPIGLLIELGGQSAVRRHEGEAWDKIVERNDKAIIAAPGGMVADPTLYARVLETAHSIWLEASPEDHMQRVVEQGDFRPMASNKAAMEDLRSILDARSADYARADARFDTSSQPFDRSLELLEKEARALLRRS